MALPLLLSTTTARWVQRLVSNVIESPILKLLAAWGPMAWAVICMDVGVWKPSSSMTNLAPPGGPPYSPDPVDKNWECIWVPKGGPFKQPLPIGRSQHSIIQLV